jgi:LytS/YehU family sensor histidine kinase
LVQDGLLTVVVENDRDEEAPARKKRSGVGLKNVRGRLEARYGKNASLSTDVSEDKFRVSLSMPAEYSSPQSGAAQ